MLCCAEKEIKHFPFVLPIFLLLGFLKNKQTNKHLSQERNSKPQWHFRNL